MYNIRGKYNSTVCFVCLAIILFLIFHCVLCKKKKRTVYIYSTNHLMDAVNGVKRITIMLEQIGGYSKWISFSVL